jgi:hypothetical protein
VAKCNTEYSKTFFLTDLYGGKPWVVEADVLDERGEGEHGCRYKKYIEDKGIISKVQIKTYKSLL